MLSDTPVAQEPPDVKPEAARTATEDSSKSKQQGVTGPSQPSDWPGAAPPSAQFPPPKTDKPRPHVCATCTRSFARLEHLKRHERSHTKEKPFECPECTRCFARRDLLLRHQQKLHLTTTPSSRPRNGRRESTSGAVSSAKVRKNSQAGANGLGSMRPRANTISHIDGATLGMMAPMQQTMRRQRPNLVHHRHTSMADYDQMMSGSSRSGPNRMLKINTDGLNVDVGGSLRTAPAFGGFPNGVGMDDVFFGGGNTVNPAQLHFADSPHSMLFDSPASPFAPGFAFGPGQVALEDENNFDWISGFESQMSFSAANEHAIAGSSPSAMSGGSPSRGDSLNDSQMHLTPEQWQDTLLSQVPPAEYDNKWGLTADMHPDPLSPTSMDMMGPDIPFSTPTFSVANSMTAQAAFSNPMLSLGSQTNSPNTAASVSSGSNRHSSVTSIGTDVITDATRSTLLNILAHSAPASHRKFSQPAVSSPLSPGFAQRPRSAMGASLPSTADLQRFINSYIHNFHPRLPFLHIPTLCFDTLNANHRSQSAKAAFGFSASAVDGGCLLLSMASIGALFEFEYTTSKELHDMAKRLIHPYLDERRRADMCAAIGVQSHTPDGSTQSTPLWLVQAMLLNIVYGYNCGDRPPADVNATHCATLVNLARNAGLTRASDPLGMDDIHLANDLWGTAPRSFDDTTWFTWKIKEEKKRTLYSIFIVSSVLVSVYNFPPCLTNSEIGLDLPCDEILWSAETPAAWFALGGGATAEQGIPFAKALSSLLTSSQRHPVQLHQLYAQNRPTDARLTSPNLPPPSFRSSSFGCLILINALHNYIWETRQRHLGRQWTTQETEAMQAHIGPALLAYQAVWRESSHHSVQRPNVHLGNDIAADCVPLLDLAFVRLFLSLGRSKECFWSRDWDGISREIASGCEIISRNNSASGASPDQASPGGTALPRDSITVGSDVSAEPSPGTVDHSTKRERHLRKAASHAARSLQFADAHHISLADFPTREVNLGLAVNTLECAEILAEWITIVQERIGSSVGLLGRDKIDFEAVPGIVMIDSEDRALLATIEDVVHHTEVKLDNFQRAAAGASEPPAEAREEDRQGAGLATRLLKVAARSCNCAATWSVMNLMASNLEAHAAHMQARAEQSLLPAK